MPTPMSRDQIAAAVSEMQGWSPDGVAAIEKAFTFRDHITAMGFVNRVAMIAETMDHHPDLRIVYNRVTIRLNSHDAGGVTQRDLRLAKRIDEYV